MIKKIIFPSILVVAIVLGGVSGDFLRNKTAAGSGNEKNLKPKTKSTHGKKDTKNKKSKKNKHGTEDIEQAGDVPTVTYIKFKRQFVVPIIGNGKIKSLVLLNLNLELGEGAPQNAYNLEPKLRDAIMRELLALSHEGVFLSDLTSAVTYDRLRVALIAASQSVIKNGVTDVLILDLMRQDQ